VTQGADGAPVAAVALAAGQRARLAIHWRDRFGNVAAPPPASEVLARVAPGQVAPVAKAGAGAALTVCARARHGHLAGKALLTARRDGDDGGRSGPQATVSAAHGGHALEVQLYAELAGVYQLELWLRNELVTGDALETTVEAGTSAPPSCAARVAAVAVPLTLWQLGRLVSRPTLQAPCRRSTARSWGLACSAPSRRSPPPWW